MTPISKYIVIFLMFFASFSDAQSQKSYLKFGIDSLLQTAKNTAVFLKESTLKGRIVRLKISTSSAYKSAYDLAYYVVSGNGKLKTGDRVFTLHKGAIVFIPRGSRYSIFESTVPLQLFELSSRGEMAKMVSGYAGAEEFSLDRIESKRSGANNIWNPFIKRNSMIYGLYMLPKSLGDDSALTHKWDEVNLITKGAGKFQVGVKVMDVKQGDIIYVRKGNPHYFHSLSRDLDILIFFEMKSLESQ